MSLALASWMLRGATARKFLVPAKRSKVMFPGQAGALTKLVAPPRVAIFREQAVDGALQRDLQGGELSAGGEGPGILQREDRRVGGAQPGVLQGLACIVGGLGDVP